MSVPVDEAVYLFRSERRVRMLLSLAGGPQTPSELAAATDASRKTARRALGTFEEYGWVRRLGRQYEMTRLGDLVAERVQSLLGAVELTRTLRPIASTLPESFDVDLGGLEDVRVTVPEVADTVAPARRMVEVLDDADEISVAAFAVAPGAVEATRDSERADLVLTPAAIEFILDDPTMLSHLEGILAAGWSVRRYDGELAYNLVIADEAVMLGLVDDSDAPSGLVESTDEAVLDWASERFERLRRQADPLDPDRLDG